MAANDGGNVRFVRIRGRIVPIKSKAKNGDTVVSALAVRTRKTSAGERFKTGLARSATVGAIAGAGFGVGLGDMAFNNGLFKGKSKLAKFAKSSGRAMALGAAAGAIGGGIAMGGIMGGLRAKWGNKDKVTGVGVVPLKRYKK